jgi:hypothetical protein
MGAETIVEYPSLNETLPFQIDGWLRVNDDREIEAFDLVFRHFPSVNSSSSFLLSCGYRLTPHSSWIKLSGT